MQRMNHVNCNCLHNIAIILVGLFLFRMIAMWLFGFVIWLNNGRKDSDIKFYLASPFFFIADYIESFRK